MKKIINAPENVVQDMLEGLLAMHSGWVRLSGYYVLLRSDFEDVRERHVALLSGGGSGHEPAHFGYVGKGMLNGAVAGEVFTSPSTNSVLAAVRHATGKPGVLLIVKNYTGDRLNFGLAAEMAKADGLKVETVYVEDDVALLGSEQNAGRRGLAGTVLVHKIAGAAASSGRSLDEVAELARAIAKNLSTMGVSLSAGTIPAAGKPSFTMGDHDMELGLGIHGEPGMRRLPLEQAAELGERLVSAIVAAQELMAGERIVALINNLGVTTPMELAIFGRSVLNCLQARDLVTERVYCGTFLSSLDTAGVSLSLLRVDDDRLRLLDAPTEAPAWPRVAMRPTKSVESRVIHLPATEPQTYRQPTSREGRTMQALVIEACKSLERAESHLTELDRITGDGDLGTSLVRGTKAILSSLNHYPFDDPAAALKAIAHTVQEAVGGSSGPLYAVFLLRGAEVLEQGGADDPLNWAKAVLAGCKGISVVGGAVEGDRTMLDALTPFGQTLKEGLEQERLKGDALRIAADCAEAAASETAGLIARRGRSSYIGGREVGTPDPGASAAAIWLQAVVSSWTTRELEGRS